MNTPTTTIIHNRRKDGKGTLEIKVYFPNVKKQIYISTGLSVEEQYYDKDIKKISPDVKGYTSINTAIKLTIHAIKEIISILQGDNDRPITPQEFLNAYKVKKIKDSGDNTADFIDFFEKEMDRATELSTGTITSHKQAFELLKDYKAVIPFSSIDYELAIGFDRFLRKKYDNLNTVRKHNNTFRRYVAMANKLNYLVFESYNSFMLFASSKQEVSKAYLSPDEIEKIENLELKAGSKERDVQQMFLFAYYTALRVSDILSLRFGHFKVIDGDLYLIKVIWKLRKYHREIKINLSKVFDGKGEKVISPYLPSSIDYERLVFLNHTPSSLYFYLKKIVKQAGIKKPISFHTARHSSLTAIAAKSGSIFTVMKHGGISNTKTAEGYIHLSEEVFNA